jgi:hypothetical protein
MENFFRFLSKECLSLLDSLSHGSGSKNSSLFGLSKVLFAFSNNFKHGGGSSEGLGVRFGVGFFCHEMKIN